MGLTADNKPLYMPVPEPGKVLWVLGYGSDLGAHWSRLYSRVTDLPF